MKKPLLLEIKDLKLQFSNNFSLFTTTTALNLTIHQGECVGIFGESGCGKTSLALSIINLHPYFTKKGHIYFKNQDISHDCKNFLGTSIAMVFQSPLSSLNPTMKIYKQISEALIFHGKIDKKLGKAVAIEWLSKLDIENPHRLAEYYPHQLSGGQRQRVCLAIALAMNPELLILDEPMTALDPKTQEKIIHVLQQQNIAMMIISHDLFFLQRMCQKIYHLEGITELHHV